MLSFTRLDTARTFRGLSTEEACTRLGLDIRQWQSFEADGAPVALAEQLANALGFPQDFFYRPALSDASQARGAFRAKARVSSRTRQAARASSLIGTEVYHWVRAHFSLPALDVPDLSNETPQMAAQLLRSIWNLGTRPAPNLVQLCESRGISVAGLGLEDLLEKLTSLSMPFHCGMTVAPTSLRRGAVAPKARGSRWLTSSAASLCTPTIPRRLRLNPRPMPLPQNSSFRTRRASNTFPTTHRWRGCSSSKPPFASQPSQPHGACTKSVVAQTGTTRSSIAFSRCADSAPLNLAVVPFTNARASLTRSQATISIRFTIRRLSLAFPPNWPAVSRSKYAFRWSSLAPRRVTVQYPA